MANILLTNSCNATCAFCFAEHFTNQTAQFLCLDDLDQRIELIQHSGIDQLRLMGGEPTLHPAFEEIARRVLAAGLKLIVFSNGYMPERTIRVLENIPPSDCAVLVNMNARSRSTSAGSLRHQVFERLSQKITAGYTILHPFFDLSPLFETIKAYGLQPKLRLGLALPTLDGKNAYLSQKKYPLAAKSILDNAEKAHQLGIRIEFDCGFVRCMFTDEQQEALDHLGVIHQYHCAPNLDIGLDGNIFHCFSLHTFQTALNEVGSINAANGILKEQRALFQDSGIYPRCSSCEHKINGECSGGCLALTMQRFHGNQV